MSRYTNNRIRRTRDGRRVYRTRIYPNIPMRDDDTYVVTQTGDRLDLLSFQYYGSQTFWWIIAAANNIHNSPLGLKDGIVLRIPQNYIEIERNFREV